MGLLNNLSTPGRQRAYAAGTGGFALLLAGIDWAARAWGAGSFMAPTHALLWVSIALGGGVGGVVLATTWLMPRPVREFYAEFARLPPGERGRWRYQRRNLLYSGWLLPLILGLAGWCWYRDVFALPAAAAMNAVFFVALPGWAIPPAEAGRGRRHPRRPTPAGMPRRPPA